MKKNIVQRISDKISSPMIVDQNDFLIRSPFLYAQAFIKTRLALNSAESNFLDFNRKSFPLFAKDRYFDLVSAWKRKDKVDLMRLLSVPLYDVMKAGLSDGQLPFKLYKEISDVQLMQARIFKLNSSASQNETWYQMTLKFNYVNQGKDIIKYNVLERRLSDTTERDWRICRIE